MCSEERRADDEYATYLAQFAGNSPQQIGQAVQDHRGHMQSLRERRAMDRTTCCAVFGPIEDDLVHPSLHSPLKTDMRSLGDAHGRGFECAEVCRAICVSQPPVSAQQHGLGPSVREGPGFLDIRGPRRADGDVWASISAAPLEAPADFARVEFDWAASSAEQRPLSGAQAALLQSCLKHFLKAMVPGVSVQLRLDPEEVRSPDALPGMPAPQAGGQNIDAVLSLSSDLSTLLLLAGGVQRAVPMTTIRSARPPEDSASQRSWFLPNEREQMVVLRIAGSRFVRLRFPRKDQAAFFGTCMRLLLKARPADYAPSDRSGSPSPLR